MSDEDEFEQAAREIDEAEEQTRRHIAEYPLDVIRHHILDQHGGIVRGCPLCEPYRQEVE